MEGKGVGVVATRDIEMGECLLSEAPAIVFDSSDSYLSRSASVQRQFNAQPGEVQTAIMSLHDAYAACGQITLAGIVSTNSHTRGSGCTGGLVCVEGSRFNHSCTPNCEQSWDEGAGRLSIFASAPIRAGTELCIFYVEVRRPAAARRSELQKKYRFPCDCARCLASDAGESGESDQRRERILALEEAALVAVAAQEGLEAVALVREALLLLDEEALRLNRVRLRLCCLAQTASQRTGEARGTAAWAAEAYRLSCACNGPEHASTRELLDRVNGAGVAEH